MFSLNCKVTTSTCDSEGRLKLYSALQMMQDCSEMWIDSEPAVRDSYNRQGISQLLASRQVEIIRVPRFKEQLTVTTSVFDVKPMFGFRNTFIYDADGKPCYKTWSMGAFVDKQTGKLKRVDESALTGCTIEQKLEMDYKDRRIILPKAEGETFAPIKVLRADIDYNRHMNNANYIRMAMELLPEDFELKGLRVEYRVAAKLGDVLIPTMYKTDSVIIVSLSVGDNVSAIIEFSKMITKDNIETAYAFLHQKQRIYVHSTLDWQKDDIEIAIGDYADEMNRELLGIISGGRTDFLRDHRRFQEDITKAVDILEKMI